MRIVFTLLSPGQTRVRVDRQRVCIRVVLTLLAPGQTRVIVDRQEFV